jgi:hypothetical protein
MFASERVWGQSTVFTFGPDVPPDQQQLVRDTITLGHQFFQTYFDTTVQSTTRVFVYADSERLIEVYLAVRNLSLDSSPWVLEQWKDCGTGEAGFDWIFQCAAGDGWDIAIAPDDNIRNHRIKKILHEYAHTLQNDLAATKRGCFESAVPCLGPR